MSKKGGRIDIAHHFNNAKRALGEFVALDNAVGKALEKTKESETLIVVTADHSHGSFCYFLIVVNIIHLIMTMFSIYTRRLSKPWQLSV